jgi:hypothetical protein
MGMGYHNVTQLLQIVTLFTYFQKIQFQLLNPMEMNLIIMWLNIGFYNID